MISRKLEGVRVTVRAFADGTPSYAEIEPLVPLAAKVELGNGIDIALVKRAEAAVADLAKDYHRWAAADIERLRAAAAALRETDAVVDGEAVYTLAHDLKGQGGSFGYPLVTQLAASLCRLIEGRQYFDGRVHAAVAAHLDALDLVVTDRLSGEQAAVSRPLLSQLARLLEALT